MSTERLAENQGTERIDTSESTVRIGENSPQVQNDDTSTQRIDAANAPGMNMGQQKQAMQDDVSDIKKTGEVFTPGQVIELNEKKYFIESLISMSSGEAVIYKVSANDKVFVLKYYKIGYPIPDAVLAKIKNNPRDKIIKLIDFGRHNEQGFEIMEYAEGGTLDDCLKEKGFIRDTAALKNIVGQIAEGLRQLHEELNIIYQDLKPENIYFRDRERTSVVLADFGISNVMENGEAKVEANATREYAAPELARTLNEKFVIVGPPVDYFALGVTMFHIWLGTKPFQGIAEPVRVRQIKNRAVEFPQDMEANYKMLIQGFIEPEEKQRWGNQHIRTWLAGGSLKSDYQKTLITYEQAMFNESEGYSSPAELAALLAKHQQRGTTYLYSNIVTSWLERSGNMLLLEEIKNILSAYAEDKEAGLYFAIYTLDPDRPFISQGGRECSTTAEIADAIMNESEYYMEELKKKEARLYLYFEAREGTNGREVADELRKNFETYSPKRALTLVYLKFQEDGGQSMSIGSKTYQSPEEAAAETDPGQIALIKQAVQEEDSLFLVWMSDHYGEFFGSTDAFCDMPVSDKFFLLGKFRFLSYKELSKDWKKTAIIDLRRLIQSNPGRFDLFEAYAQQGLPFYGKMDDPDWRPTVLTYLATFFKEMVSDTNTGLELVRFLHKHDAEVNECSGDGSFPLTTAIHNRNVPLVSLLLELGADPNKEEKESAPLLWALYKKEDSEDEKDRLAMANLLLDHKANVNISDNNASPLCLAIHLDSSEKIAFIKRLLAAGVDVNATPSDKKITPLMDAVVKHEEAEGKENKKNALEVMELLLKNGAKTEVLTAKGYSSPLMGAADADDVDVVNLLLKYGAKKEFADADGDTAFVYAKKKNNNNIAGLLDPGAALKGKGALIAAGKAALSVLAIAWVFLTMDVLARIMSSLHFSYPVQLGASILFSHLLMAYVFIIIFGVRDYLERLKGTFNFVKSGLLYIIGIPIVFPLVIALLQWLTKKLPDGVSAALSLPADLLTRPSSGFGMLLLYLVCLAAPMAAIMVVSKVTWEFTKTMRVYRQYS